MKLSTATRLKKKESIFKIAEQYVDQLFEDYPPGLGGIMDPCDFCIGREHCGLAPDSKESCIGFIAGVMLRGSVAVMIKGTVFTVSARLGGFRL